MWIFFWVFSVYRSEEHLKISPCEMGFCRPDVLIMKINCWLLDHENHYLQPWLICGVWLKLQLRYFNLEQGRQKDSVSWLQLPWLHPQLLADSHILCVYAHTSLQFIRSTTGDETFPFSRPIMWLSPRSVCHSLPCLFLNPNMTANYKVQRTASLMTRVINDSDPRGCGEQARRR